MRVRTILMLTLALCFLGVGVGFAYAMNNDMNSDMNIGTWKLNEAQSKIPSGVTKNTMVVYESVGNDIKVTTDGTDKDGQPIHTEWTGRYDGKDYPLTGDPAANTRSYTKVNDHRLALSNKKNGKVMLRGSIVLSADGRSRTLTLMGADAAGKAVTSIAVYDKQ
ncbi:MAG TPA: hypothetical protein VH250_04725 [Granulicella sp.]|nr:hypothetical protein [Granulicella sp.]